MPRTWELRPAAVHDREAVLELLAERDRADFADPVATRLLLLNGWRLREFVPFRDAVVVQDAGAVAGYAAVLNVGTLAFVHPAREGEGIGRALLDWSEERARGRDAFRQGVAASNHRAQALLESAGYRRVRSAYMMAVDAAGVPPAPPPPDGVAFAQIDLGRDSRDIHETVMRGFADNADFRAETFEAFHDDHLASPDVHLPSSLIARHGEEAIGFVLCRRFDGIGYVDLLAVDPMARRMGLGAALLLSAIEHLREDGARQARLHVSADNVRARRLYKRVGMAVAQEVLVLEKPEPGRPTPIQ